MGYTTSIKIKNKKTKNKVYDFLRKNYTPYSKLFNFTDEYVRGPLTTDLSYDHDPDIIGFDYIAGSDGWYVTSLLRVIAIKLGIDHTRYDSENKPFTWRIGDPLNTIIFEDKKTTKQIEKELNRISKLWDKEFNI